MRHHSQLDKAFIDEPGGEESRARKWSIDEMLRFTQHDIWVFLRTATSSIMAVLWPRPMSLYFRPSDDRISPS